MGSGIDRIVVNVALAVLVFVGVSGSISPWLDEIYSEIAIGALIIGLPVSALWFWLRWYDFGFRREVRDSWKVNGAIARQLAEKHAAHPEVARQLAERLAEGKRRQQLGAVPPPTGQ